MSQIFQRFVINMETEFRRGMLEGVEHLVIPSVMMVEGVFAGNQGPVYYPEKQLKKACSVWNHKPVVVYHPQMNGQFISACDQEVINTRKAGILLNTRWDGKQRTEVWANPKRLDEIDERILPAVEAHEAMEVSNGLFYDPDRTKGKFGDKDYDMIALNHRGDHLAILPDRVGACSIADGAGLGVVNQSTSWESPVVKAYLQSHRSSLAKSGICMEDGALPIVNKSDLENAIKDVGKVKDADAAKRHIIKRAFALNLLTSLPEEWQVKDVKDILNANELSNSEKHCRLQDMLASKVGEPGKWWNGWIVDVYSNVVIFYDKDAMYAQRYKIGAGDNISLVGKPTEVNRVSEYRSASDGSAVVNESLTDEELPMAFDKKKHVDALIAANVYQEGDRTELMATNEKVLEKIKVPEKTPAPTPTPEPPAPTPAVNQDPPKKKITLNELAAQLDEEGQATLNELQTSYTTEKEVLVKGILANQNNAFTEEELRAMKAPQLRKLAKTAGIVANQTVGGDQVQQLLASLGARGLQLGPSYIGPGGPITANAAEDVEPLVAPKMDFGAAKPAAPAVEKK